MRHEEGRWCFVTDDDGHNYLCPAHRAGDFQFALEEEDYEAMELIAERIDAFGGSLEGPGLDGVGGGVKKPLAGDGAPVTSGE